MVGGGVRVEEEKSKRSKGYALNPSLLFHFMSSTLTPPPTNPKKKSA
jgi:hypothetical protein